MPRAVRRRPLAAAVTAAVAVALASCGGGGDDDDRPGLPPTLTVYASVPRQGVQARQAEAVAAGARLALADARGRAGGRRIRLVELNSAAAESLTWDPAMVKENADRAADDPGAVAYIGELDTGGSAVSLPVTNEASLLQVSPADGLTALTRQQPGGPRAGPERFYPSDARSFVRLVPTDYAQAATLVAWARARGARRVALVQDASLSGRELSAQALVAARRLRLPVTEQEEAGDDPDGFEDLARDLAERRPDAVIYTGLAAPTSGRLLAAIADALPAAELYGSSAVATAAPAPRAMPPLRVLKPTRPARTYGPAARRVLERLAADHGDRVPAEALLGYEAMRLVLSAVGDGARAGTRAAVLRSALEPRARRSPLGDYRVLPGGDAGGDRFAAYRRTGERLAYEGVRGPAPGPP